MDARFLPHNIQLEDAQRFMEQDLYLCKLKQLPYVCAPYPLKQLPIDTSGIYTLTGGGQTGKTTLAKQWIAKLLASGIPAKNIIFFPGELINDHQDLIQLLQAQLLNNHVNGMQYVLLDDVTYIHNWDKAIKFAVDTGLLNHTMLMLMSSDSTLSNKLQTSFPDRDNKTKKIDFHLYPLTFRETVLLKHPDVQVGDINLFAEFNDYLLHGGYLPAINDIAMHGKILDSTLKTYSTWLRKEIVKHGRQEHFCLEIVTAMAKHYNDPITWNMLSRELSINHPKTIADYIMLLESLDVVLMQFALLEDTLSPAPKKARKLMFMDPFIFHAIRSWSSLSKEAFENQIKPVLDNPELCSKLVEACVTTHYQRHYPTYYIKAEGEIGLAYIYEQRFWPVVVTWTNQLRAKDLKQIMKYPNGKILTKTHRSGIIEHIRSEPLPQALWKLEDRR